MPRPGLPNPAQTAPLEELIAVVLRQFKRPLAAHGVTLTDADAAELAAGRIAKLPLDDRATALRDALTAVIVESETVLAGMGLTFEQGLARGMEDVTGWESTSEFLELANEKSNAELRIGGASILSVVFGENRWRPYVVALSQQPDDDFEPILARRVLAGWPEDESN